MTGPPYWETTARLYCSWSDFAQRSGEEAGSTKAFATSLGRLGFEPTRTTVEGRTQRIFRGLALNRNGPVRGAGHD